MVASINTGGRPTTYTAELGQKICEMVRLGFSEQSAGEYVGVARTTITSWKTTQPHFEREIDQARGGGKRFVGSQLLKLIYGGNAAATIFWLKTRTEEFRERKPEEQFDPGEFAENLREYCRRTRVLDGLVPPDGDRE